MLYSLHNFLLGLKLEGRNLEGYKLLIMDKKNRDKEKKGVIIFDENKENVELIEVVIKDIEISHRGLFFKVIDKDDNKILLSFSRVKKIYDNKGELIFDNS